MELHITRHARNRLRLYAIDVQEVERTVGHPHHVTPAAFGAQQAWQPRVQGGWLRVTFKDEGTRRIVITVTPKRTLPSGKESHAH